MLEQVGIVIVSPLRRAVETAFHIFKNAPQKPKMIVDPLYTEIIAASCDLGLKIRQTIQLYEQYMDFSEMKKFDSLEFWNIEQLDKSLKSK